MSPEPKPRRHVTLWVVRLGIGVGALVAVALAAFVVTNLSTAKPGPPLYTRDDLPPPPPDADNGWAAIRDAPAATWGGESEARALVLTAMEPDNAKTPRQLLDEAPPPDAAYRRALATCEAAFERPRFADACPPSITEMCPTIAIYRCHSLLAFEILRRLADEDPARRADGLALTSHLLRGTLDHAATATSLIGQKIAQSNLETILGLLAAMRGWLPAEDVQPLVDRVATSPADRSPRELALMGEYLRMIDALDQVSISDGHDAPTFVLDVAETRQVIDDAFREASAGGELDIADPRRERFWWFDNYTGKVLLSVLLPVGPAWQSLTADIAKNDATRARLTGR